MKKTLRISILIFLFIILSVLFIFVWGQSNTINSEDIEKIFETSGASGVSKEIHFHTILNESYADKQSLSNLMAQISQRLFGGNFSVFKDEINNDFINIISLNGQTEKGYLFCFTGTIMKDRINSEAHLALTLTGDYISLIIEDIEKNIEIIMKQYCLNYKTGIYITGYFNDIKDIKKLDSICKNIFNKAGAIKVSSIKDNNLISLYAYSPQIPTYTKYSGSRVNLAISLRYNACEKKTYIWLASPVYDTEEY